MEERQEAWGFDEEIQAKQTIDLAAFEALGREVFEQRAVVEGIEKQLAEESRKLETLKARVLDILKSTGKEKYHVEGYGMLYTTDRFTVGMPKDPARKSEFFKFLARKGVFQDLVTVHSQTLNAFYKAEMEAAQVAGASDFHIPGLEEPRHVVTISMRKG